MTEEEFSNKFPDEKSCVTYIRNILESTMSLICDKCEGGKLYFDNTNRCWNCRKCGKRKSLTTETIFAYSKFPLMYWMKVIYHLSNNKDMFTVNQLQEILNEHTPNHVRIMHMRIRSAMLQYLKENKIKCSVNKKTKSQINFVYKGISEETSKLYIAEYVYRSLPENEGDDAFDNLLKICLTHTTDVKLKRSKPYIKKADRV